MDVPEALQRNVLGVWGEDGRAWLQRLPLLVDEVTHAWGLELEQPFSMTFHWVFAVRRDDDTPAVLKLAPPGSDHQAVEAAALSSWDGQGAVRLLRRDPLRGALLLQRADPGTPVRELLPARDDEATGVLAAVMRMLHQAPVPETGVPPLTSLRGTFERYLRAHSADEPLPRRLVERALGLFDALNTDVQAPVLLHGDLHHDNVLRDDATAAGWLAIDPHGWIGDPGFDVGPMLYNPDPYQRSDALLALVPQRVERLADALDMSADRVAGWGLVTAVLSQLWSVEDGDPVGGRPLDVALILDQSAT